MISKQIYVISILNFPWIFRCFCVRDRNKFCMRLTAGVWGEHDHMTHDVVCVTSFLVCAAQITNVYVLLSQQKTSMNEKYMYNLYVIQLSVRTTKIWAQLFSETSINEIYIVLSNRTPISTMKIWAQLLSETIFLWGNNTCIGYESFVHDQTYSTKIKLTSRISFNL